MEGKWLLDSGCTLILISLEVCKRIPEDKWPILDENDVEMRTAGGSLLPDYGKVQLYVIIKKQSFQHPFIVENLTNKGILGTDFLRMHNGWIDFGSNQFSLEGRMLSTKSGLSRNKCYLVSLAEKVVLQAGNRMVVAGKAPAGILAKGNWMVESLSKPLGGQCVKIGQSLVEGCSGKVTLEIFYPSEEDIVLQKNRQAALVHPVDIDLTEQQEEELVEK